MSNPIVGKIVFALFGVGAIVFGFVMLGQNAKPADWTSVMGTIVEMRDDGFSDGDRMYRPIVEYKVGDQSYTVPAAVSEGGAMRSSVGGTLEVIYDPASPATGRVVGGATALLPYGLFAFGALLLLGAAFGKPRRTTIDDEDRERSTSDDWGKG